MLSAFVDNFLSLDEWEVVRKHVGNCQDCAEQAQHWKALRKTLRQLPAPPVPADLAFRIRTRISQERGQQQQPGWVWRWANRMEPYTIPVASGVLAALLVFGVLVPTFGIPAPAGFQKDDVPLAFRTPPRLRSNWPVEVDPQVDDLVVKLLIDENGRVADYGIVRGKRTAKDIRAVQNLLLFAVFDPATVFGKPTSDTVILPLRSLRTKG
ncbi:MAG: hypothetical protein HY648_06490 [Acidobacteria bacterium]|nr:hypothetical protein [Acidobacteriota bacterium]